MSFRVFHFPKPSSSGLLKTQNNNRLAKSERLSGHTIIRSLFENGVSYFHFPFRVIILDCPYDPSVSVRLLISVSKRNLKKAVQRNEAKRIIRESFRINKHLCIEALQREHLTLLVGLIYTPKEVPDFIKTNARMITLLSHIAEKAITTAQKKQDKLHIDKKISEAHTETGSQPLLEY